MAYTTQDLVALGNEIDTNANSYYLSGGVANTANDEATAIAINATRETILVLKTALSTSTMFAAIDGLEHQALTPQQSRYLDSVLRLQQINPSMDAKIIAAIRAMFLEGVTVSRAAIEAVLVRPGNRLEQLYQSGLISEVGNFTPSTPSQIRAALA